jgi:hypothetical protein
MTTLNKSDILNFTQSIYEIDGNIVGIDPPNRPLEFHMWDLPFFYSKYSIYFTGQEHITCKLRSCQVIKVAILLNKF